MNSKLFATGFNAWSQLSLGRRSSSPEDEAEDIFTFRKVLEGGNLDVPTSKLTYTIVPQGTELRRAGTGYPHDDQQLRVSLDEVENALGETLAIDRGDTLHIRKCPSPDDASHQQSRFVCPSPVRQMAAWDAGWVILHEDGRVATMGDGRFPDCLGREVAADSPADAPCIVTDLSDLGEPISRVAAGGYTSAALTVSGGLYAWGMPSPGTTHRRQQAIGGLSGVPNYVGVGDDCDVQDVALGESHAIALTAEGDVYVIGGNENGQLGLGMPFTERASEWTKVNLQLEPGERPVRVAAGVRTSFILVAGDG
ncbi:Alpha-tubulin suppressor [Geosmithia morbida]|uniref:Alpha-tubulin suppressor n=1 Tax=Geosmithia morbida TaxID=1094350 RepID=A0A9P5D0T0_9HYPO|nr:Alpha-tubulin suppressor [Geosmithia morbida]KAF4121967.1 Alpha-tubulin suppressor [Geosmithia morbida]